MNRSEKIGAYELYSFYRRYTGVNKEKLTEQEKLKIKHRLQVDRSTFSKILNSFNKELASILICEAQEFKMPARLGRVYIRKHKRKIKLNEDGSVDSRSLSVDWKATGDLWKRLYPGKSKQELKAIKGKQLVHHLNEHTEGYIMKLYWNKSSKAVTNRNIYHLVLTHTNKRMIAKVIKSDSKINYYE